MPKLSTRLDGFTESVIRKMTRISNKYGAINLSQGFPDFDPPKEITDRLKTVADEGPHQYSVTWGAQNFRESLAKKQEKFMGISINPNNLIRMSLGQLLSRSLRHLFYVILQTQQARYFQKKSFSILLTLQWNLIHL